jgi:hypothetical protein
MTTISKPEDEWVAKCICNKYDGYGNVIHCCPEELREQREKEDRKHVKQMKSEYRESTWMWFVEGTGNDCELAAVHRRWLHNKGIPYDFNIHDDVQREHYFGKYEERETQEEEENEYDEQKEKEQERENAYVYEMHQKYGGQWYWTVENTEEDSPVAEKHRQWVDDKCQKGAYEEQ